MKIIKTLITVLLLFVMLAGISGLYIGTALPNVDLKEEIKVEISQQRIERGRYLANHVAACMDCHGKRDWSTFSGPIVPNSEGSGGEKFDQNMGFPGTFYATNLTPHHLDDWSDSDIYTAITAGESKDGRALFPVMAYPRFGKMDREDIYSIIAYLRSLEPIETEQLPAPALDFPVNILNNLGPAIAEHTTIPSKTDSVRYGGYLVNAAGCVDCHSKSDKGSIIAGTEFTGGMEFKGPAGIIRAPNITAHPSAGIGAWSKDMFIERFKSFEKSALLPKVGPNDLNSTMPWNMYAGMTREDLGYIYLFLRSLPQSDNVVEVRSYNSSL